MRRHPATGKSATIQACFDNAVTCWARIMMKFDLGPEGSSVISEAKSSDLPMGLACAM